MKRYVMLFCCLLVFKLSSAQEEKKVMPDATPIPVELNMGNNSFGIQVLMNKPFSPNSKFSFFEVALFNSDYANKLENLDFINVLQVRYTIYKGISVGMGLVVNSKLGVVPTAGPVYTYVGKTVFLVLSPSIDISKTRNLQGLTVLEYKPALTEKLNLYSRIQAMYNYNLRDEIHSRSYVQLRLGVGMRQYQFGLSANLDYYGPQKNLVGNYGGFLRANL